MLGRPGPWADYTSTLPTELHPSFQSLKYGYRITKETKTGDNRLETLRCSNGWDLLSQKYSMMVRVTHLFHHSRMPLNAACFICFQSMEAVKQHNHKDTSKFWNSMIIWGFPIHTIHIQTGITLIHKTKAHLTLHKSSILEERQIMTNTNDK